MGRELAKEGVSVEAIYYCHHRPEDGCDCCKPASGLFWQEVKEYHIDLGCSYLVGDKLSDLLPAHALGSKAILVITGHGIEHSRLINEQDFKPDHMVPDLYAATQLIVSHSAT